MAFVPVAERDDVWVGEKRVVQVGLRRVLLVALADGVHAYEDRCLHLGLSFEAATLAEGVLTCAAHHWQYDAASGRGVNPGNVCLRRYPVREHEGRILVDVEAPEERPA